jgi:hypothetical protein
MSKTEPSSRLPEHHTRSGAETLAARLQAHWRGRATFRIVALPSYAGDAVMYVIRSDLLNGSPRK